jgi:hypothetical protein
MIVEMYQAIKGIIMRLQEQGYQVDWTSDIGQWAVTKLRDIMCRAETFSERDGSALVEIMIWQKGNETIFDEYGRHFS